MGSAGYRVFEKNIEGDDNTISDDTSEDVNDNDIKYDTRQLKSNIQSQLSRGKRKVVVRRLKSKKPGLTAAVIPFQPALLLSSQYQGRRGERRLVGERDLVRVMEPEQIVSGASDYPQL